MDRLEQWGPLRIQVSGGGHPQPPLQGGPQIGHDIAEHVAGHDHLETLRRPHQLHGQGVHVQVLRLDPGVARRDLAENPLPQVVPVGQDVGLVAHGDLGASGLAREPEGVFDDPFHALAGIDVLLNGHFVRRPLLEESSHAHVEALGVLAKHHQIHVGLRPVFQRAEPPVEELHRPHVHVEVQAEAQAEQDVGGVLHVRDARVAQRAQVDGIVVVAEVCEDGLRKGLASPEVALGAEVEMDEVEPGPGHAAHGLQDLDALGNDVRADAVAGDDCDPGHAPSSHAPHPWRRFPRGNKCEGKVTGMDAVVNDAHASFP